MLSSNNSSSNSTYSNKSDDGLLLPDTRTGDVDSVDQDGSANSADGDKSSTAPFGSLYDNEDATKEEGADYTMVTTGTKSMADEIGGFGNSEDNDSWDNAQEGGVGNDEDEMETWKAENGANPPKADEEDDDDSKDQSFGTDNDGAGGTELVCFGIGGKDDVEEADGTADARTDAPETIDDAAISKDVVNTVGCDEVKASDVVTCEV